MNMGYAQGVSSQQAEVDRLKNENIDLSLAVGMEKKANELLEARIRDLEAEAEALRTSFTIVEADLVAELEARKKASSALAHWIVENAVVGFSPRALLDKLTALEATLPKGGA